MASDDVTMGEVVRRLDSIAAQLAQITTSLAEDRRHNTETFVRKDVLESRLDAMGQRFVEVEKDVEDGKKEQARQQDRNRSMAIALIGIAIPALISIIGLVLSVLGKGGGVG